MRTALRSRHAAPLALFALLLAPGLGRAAGDPAPPRLIDPAQTEDPSVYAARRLAVMKEMSEGVAVIFAEGAEDGDGYRQGSDLYYLTGVVEEGAVLVLAPKERTYREFLLLPSRDPEQERWTGERDPIGIALRRRYGFEKIYRTGRLDDLVLDLVARSPVLWQVAFPPSLEGEAPKDIALYKKIEDRLPGVTTKSMVSALARMRSRHSPAEVALIQRAIRISEEGFRAAVRAIGPGVSEGVLEAEAERVFKARGARRPAYPSIVGSGPNSTVLHYPLSQRTMQTGELVLMDMSAEFAHYASDITRTVPVDGRFSPEQRTIYGIVLAAQRAALARVRPGAYFEDLDAAARKVIEDSGYGDAFLHGVGHFVGLDVHDAGAYHEPLAAGMVITLEPGIYLRDKNLGIRIEDDVLVTETGARYMSDGLPREPDEVEAWMANRSGSDRDHP